MKDALPRWGLGLLGLWCVSSCDSSLDLRYAPSPWPATHTSLAVLLSVGGEPVGAPEVFGPGEPLKLSLPSAAQRLIVFTYEDLDGDLARCGATFGGSYAALPPAALAFDARNPGAELQLTPLTAPPPLELRFARCEPSAGPACPTLQLTTYPVTGAEDGDLHGLVVHRGQVLVSGGNGGGPFTHQLYRLEGDAVVPVPLPEPIGNPQAGVRSMTSDGESLWVSQGNQVFRLDADLRVATSTQTAFFIQRLNAEANHGPVVATSDDNSGTGGAVDLTGQLPGFTEFANGALLMGPERRFLVLKSSIRRWDQDSWQLERRFDVQETYNAFGGDAEVVAAGTILGDLLIRDERTGAWHLHPPQLNYAYKLRVVVPMGPQRVLVAGNDGFIGLWDRDRWCNPELRVHTNLMLSGVALDGAAYLSTSHIEDVQGDAPLLVKVELVE